MLSSRKFAHLMDVLLPGLLLGSGLVATRFALGQFAPLTHVAVRLAVASLVMWLGFGVLRGRVLPRAPAVWLHAAMFGLIGTAITMAAYTNSLKYQSSGVTSLLASLSPVVTALLAHQFLHDEPLNRYRVGGALVAFSGAALLLIRGESGLHELARADWRGYAWALLGMASNSAGLVYARRFLRASDAYAVTSIRILTGAVVIGLLNGLVYGFNLSQVRLSGAAALLYSAIAGTVLAFLLYLYSIQRHGATVASQSEYIVPLAATVFGVLFLHEQVTLTMLGGMLLIFLGLFLFDRGRAPRNFLTDEKRRVKMEAKGMSNDGD